MRRAWTGAGRGGFALIVVCALLALLSLVGAAYVHYGSVAREVSQMHTLRARAGILARSGLERAAATVGRRPVPDPRDRANDWTFRDPPTGVYLEAARNPSCHDPRGEPWTDADGDRAWDPGEAYQDLNGNGRYDGISGRLRGSLWDRGDVYVLRVEDESAKININGGFLDAEDRDNDTIPDHRDADVRAAPADPKDTGRGWNFQLARIVDVLGTVKEDSDADFVLDGWEDWNGNGAIDPAPIGVAGLGQAIVASRPPGGYRSVDDARRDVSAALGVPVPDLSPYLTVSSWIDRSVVHPTAYSSSYEQWMRHSEIMKGRNPPRLEEGGRPPVNLNVAHPAVLYALVWGLRATNTGDLLDGMTMETRDYIFGDDLIQRIVWALTSARRANPFDTWREFQSFCEGIGQGPSNALLSYRAIDVLSANFDPNTRLNKHQPESLMWRRCDKTDMIHWSTEGSLGPTGTFRVRSIGRVEEGDGSPAARGEADAAVEAFVPLRQTTQREFLAGRTPEDSAVSCLSLADPAWRTTGASASWNAWGPGRGLAVVTFPAPPPALPARASDIDGSIALATTETEPDDYGPGATLVFLHHFDDSWNADVGGAPAILPGVHTSALQTDPTADVWPDPPGEPNTLCPDGAHSQKNRSPAYAGPGNFPPYAGTPGGNRGAIVLWTRSNGPAEFQTVSSPSWQGTRVLMTFQRLAGGQSQSLQLGRISEWFGFVVESGAQPSDTAYEQFCSVNFTSAYGIVENCRWHLVAAAFDTNESARERQLWLDVGAGYRTLSGGIAYTRYGTAINNTTTEDLLSGDAALILGNRGDQVSGIQRSNHLLDEFAIYDLGDDGAAAQGTADLLHADGMRLGRYYKEDDGRFLSAVLEPAPGSEVRVLSSAWTAFHPSEIRPETRDTSNPGMPTVWSARALDPALARSRVEVDLMAEDGTTVLRTLTNSAPVGERLGRFRYRVRFVNGLAELGLDPLNQGVMETPWFDDITFACQSATGPRVLSWRQ